MMRRFFILVGAAGLLPLGADDLPPTKPASAIVKLDANRVKIGQVLVDGDRAEVSFPGKTVTADRVLEVFVSAPHGRTYEGLIVTEAEPIDVATALKLLGLEGGEAVKFQGDPTSPVGDPVEIYVAWTDPKTAKPKIVRAEELVVDVRTNKPLAPMRWVHVGSRWRGNRFGAQSCGDIITLEHYPDAVIDNPLHQERGSYDYTSNPAVVPPEGTEVTVTIKAVKPTEEEKQRAPRTDKKGLR